MKKYVGFQDLEDIKKQFESDCGNITDENVLFASYGGGCCDGDAVILVQIGSDLFTCEHAHCSCYGLEGGWELIMTSKEALKIRKFYKEYHPEFIEFLEKFL